MVLVEMVGKNGRTTEVFLGLLTAARYARQKGYQITSYKAV